MTDLIDEFVERMKKVDKTRCLICNGTGIVTAKLAPSGWRTFECQVCKRNAADGESAKKSEE